MILWSVLLVLPIGTCSVIFVIVIVIRFRNNMMLMVLSVPYVLLVVIPVVELFVLHVYRIMLYSPEHVQMLV